MQVYNGQQNGGSAGLRVIRDADEWLAVSRRLDNGLPTRLPRGQMAILVTMGSVPCHTAVDIRTITVEDNSLVVHVQRFEGGSTYGHNAIASPWALAFVPASDRAVVERDFQQLTKSVLAGGRGHKP